MLNAMLRSGRRTRGSVASRVMPVGHGHDAARDRAPRRAVVVEQRVGPAGEHGGQRVAQGDGVLDAEVHALPACRAVHVRRVAREQQPSGAVRVGDAVVDAEPRAPDDVGDDDAARAGPAVSSIC